MASKVTNSSGASRREKKITPSSYSRTIQRQGSNKLSNPESTGKDKTISSGKPTPSHIKPTLGSISESLKYVKKTVPEETAQRASLLRRRSFDKPPPISTVRTSVDSPTETLKYVKKTGPEDSSQKASLHRRRSFDKPRPISRVNSSVLLGDRTGKARYTPTTPKGSSSPKPASALSTPGTPKATSFQKSAFSAPTTPRASVTKPVPDRTFKNHKVMKSHSPAAKTIKRDLSLSRNAIQSRKNEGDIPVPSKIPTADDTMQTGHVVNEANGELTLSEQTASSENGVQALSDEIKMEDEDHDIHKGDVHEVKSSEAEEVKLSDNSSTVSESQSEPQLAVEAEARGAEREPHEEDRGETEPEAEENQSKVEINKVPKECATDEAKVEADQQKKKEENVGQNVAYSEEPAEEKKNEDNKQGTEPSTEELNSKDEEAVVAISAQPAAANAAEKRQPAGRGKKETQAYNDVIEETKNKLLETRKNKVKALVGAFETVIDYESGTR